ncbi:MAG TPA: hypothetical protein VMU42_08290, partial [Candidatus Sulfotelmatobacter sp.]|nr:hypothetical protein [Candidatus Sulfotelmatobacter sp.]
MDRDIAEREATRAESIDESEALRACYGHPSEMAVRKCLPKLDRHCRSFIALSPFLCLGTADASG